MDDLSEADVLAKVAALGDITDEQRNSIVCALIGHSNIIEQSFGYIYCGRCGDQIGDTLGSIYENKNAVIVGHNCATCKENAESLTWRDRIFAKEPFTDEEIA